MRLRGRTLRLSWRDFLCVAVMGVLFFVGGNGLITYAEKSVASAPHAGRILWGAAPLKSVNGVRELA